MEPLGIGEHVKLLWGLDYVEGVVRRLFGPPGHAMAEVGVKVDEDDSSDGEVTVSVPVDALEPAESEENALS